MSDQETWIKYIPLPAYVTDHEGFILSYNEEAAALWGRHPIVGSDRWFPAYKLFTESGNPLTSAGSAVAQAIEQGRFSGAERMVIGRPDGTQRLIESHVKLVYDNDGRLGYAVATMVDLGDPCGRLETAPDAENLREKIKAGTAAINDKHVQLLQSEDRYHKMIAEVEDYAILLLDEYGIIQNWNTGAEKIKGYLEPEIVGRHFRIFYTSKDREAGLPERLIAEAALKGKAIHEGWRQRKDSTLFWGSVVITALHDPAGKVIGFSKVTRDLTARRMAEEKLKRYSADLEFQNKELQQFAHAAAHDMKEPLRKMRYYTSFLMDSAAVRLSDKERENLRRATGAAARMQTLIDDLLTYSKATFAGGEMSQVDLNEIIEQATDTYQERIETQYAEIIVGPLPTITGIAFQLRQLFENLLGNALKYSDPRRLPRIEISAQHGCFPPNIESETGMGPYVKIMVSDNGIGFEPDKAAKIFDIFHRLDTRVQLPGTGIGLAICKRVVQNHRGFIIADGVPGRGATFTVYLPENIAS